MKLTNDQVISLFNAIQRLEEPGIKLSAKTRSTLAKNFRVTRTALRDYNRALRAIVGEKLDANGQAEKVAELQQIEVDLPLTSITEADLELEKNVGISAVALEGLMVLFPE